VEGIQRTPWPLAGTTPPTTAKTARPAASAALFALGPPPSARTRVVCATSLPPRPPCRVCHGVAGMSVRSWGCPARTSRPPAVPAVWWRSPCAITPHQPAPVRVL